VVVDISFSCAWGGEEGVVVVAAPWFRG